jgi:hypothetical protein
MNTAKQVSSGVAAFALLSFALIAFSEAYRAWTTPSEYYFGTEAMLSHGGWTYQSSTRYISTMSLEGALLFCAAATLAGFATGRRPRYAAVSIALAALAVAVHLGAALPVA